MPQKKVAKLREPLPPAEPHAADANAEKTVSVMTAEVALWSAGLSLLLVPLATIAAFTAPINLGRELVHRFRGGLQTA